MREESEETLDGDSLNPDFLPENFAECSLDIVGRVVFWPEQSEHIRTLWEWLGVDGLSGAGISDIFDGNLVAKVSKSENVKFV
jgi:hypothetical protein